MSQPPPLDKTALYKVTNAETGIVIAARVRVADTPQSRSIGLLNRASLDPDEALLITQCSSIHTFFMKFPIDVLYLDREYRVVRVVSNLVPSRLSFCLLKASQVLELKAGALASKGKLAGSLLKFEKQA